MRANESNLCEVCLNLNENQYCASTGVAPGGGDRPARRQRRNKGFWITVAPSGKEGCARRSL